MFSYVSLEVSQDAAHHKSIESYRKTIHNYVYIKKYNII